MATANFALHWSNAIAAGALQSLRVSERILFAAIVELDFGARTVYWTVDGTPTGASLFGQTPPWVEVIATEPDRRLWSQQQQWGGIFPREVPWAEGAYHHLTEQISSKWTTTIRAFGRVGDQHQDGERQSRTFVLQALGTD